MKFQPLLKLVGRKNPHNYWKRQRIPNCDRDIDVVWGKQRDTYIISQVLLQTRGEKTMRLENTRAGLNLKANQIRNASQTAR